MASPPDRSARPPRRGRARRPRSQLGIKMKPAVLIGAGTSSPSPLLYVVIVLIYRTLAHFSIAVQVAYGGACGSVLYSSVSV
jgi:hypothetical protein